MFWDVIVIGLGAVGSGALHTLARLGVRAVGIDRHAPPHALGSSHGETRVTRQAVGEGDIYVPLVQRSHALWRELEAETGETLLLECGVLILDGSGGIATHHGKPGFVESTIAAARRFGIAHETPGADELARRFPQFRLEGHERVYFEPGGGLVFPERCIAAQLARARALGAEVRTCEVVLAVEPAADGVVVHTDKGLLHASHAIIAAGPWTPGLVGAPLERVRLLRQVLHWFTAELPADYTPEAFPTFIWLHGSAIEDSFYGFPIVPGGTPGVKVAGEYYGEALARPEAMRREVGASEPAAMHAHHVAGRLAGVSAKALRSAACLYTFAPDGDFIVDKLAERITLVSACSGHGFKHSAGLGEAVARMAVDGTEPDPAFALGRAALAA